MMYPPKYTTLYTSKLTANATANPPPRQGYGPAMTIVATAAITRLMRRRRLVFAALAGGASAAGLPAQVVDYAKADRIRTFDPLLVGGRVYPVWLSDSVRFYYEMTGAGADR